MSLSVSSASSVCSDDHTEEKPLTARYNNNNNSSRSAYNNAQTASVAKQLSLNNNYDNERLDGRSNIRIAPLNSSASPQQHRIATIAPVTVTVTQAQFLSLVDDLNNKTNNNSRKNSDSVSLSTMNRTSSRSLPPPPPVALDNVSAASRASAARGGVGATCPSVPMSGGNSAGPTGTVVISPNAWDEASLRAVGWRSYVVDVALAVVFGAVALLQHKDVFDGGPHIRGFFQTDQSISLPFHVEDAVTSPELMVFAALMPVLVIIFFAIFVDKAYKDWVRFRRFLWRPLAALVFCELACSLTTDVVKNMVGRLRPDFISRCQPDYTLPGVVVEPYSGYVAQPFVCTGDPKVIKEGRRSFPSGHSSAAFVGGTYVQSSNI